MTDRDIIATELAKPLDRALVKPPPKGKYGDYVSAFDIITAANRIFGWDGWRYQVDRLEQTNCDAGENLWAVGYMALVTVEASASDVGSASKQDVGHGQGHSKSLGDAHDSAMKEAVTDALKRALRTFGNPLGLALYDSTKAHVSDNPDYDPVAEADALLETLKETPDDGLAEWSRANKEAIVIIRKASNYEYHRVLDEAKRRNTEKAA